MSRIEVLKKQNPSLNFNVIDIINMLFDKTKYTEMTLNLVKNFSLSKSEFNEYVKDLVHNYKLDEHKLLSLSSIEIKILYRLINDIGHNNFLTLKKFIDYNEKNLIDNKDLTAYKTFYELELQTSLAEIKSLGKELEKQTLKLYENDEWLVLKPLSFEASKKYGSSTKWCTTQENNPEYYLRYSKRGILIYCINKKTGNKVAAFKNLDIEYERETSFWNIVDIRVDSIDTDLPIEIIELIKKDFDTCFTTNWNLINADEQQKQIMWIESNYYEKKCSEPIDLVSPPIERTTVRLRVPTDDEVIDEFDNEVMGESLQVMEEISENIVYNNPYHNNEAMSVSQIPRFQ